MSNQSGPRSTDLLGETGSKDGLDAATSSVRGETAEQLTGDRGSGNTTEAHINAFEVGQSETPDARSSGPGETTTPGENVAALDFLAPSDRPECLGRLGPYEVLERIGQGGMGVVLGRART